MKLTNTSQKTTLAEVVAIADNPLTRMVGLLKHKSLPENHALIITKCKSIHMFFMRFAIDAVFVAKDHTVVGLVERIKPWRLSSYFPRASYVIELPEGVIEDTKTQLGDYILRDHS